MFIPIHVQNVETFILHLYLSFIAMMASGIMHALSQMKHQQQNGMFNPPRHLQAAHNQMQVRV